jgi:hypothetical protein
MQLRLPSASPLASRPGRAPRSRAGKKKRERGLSGANESASLSRRALAPLSQPADSSLSPSIPSHSLPVPPARLPSTRTTLPRPPSAGSNPTDAWLDLASFVAGGAGDAGRAGIFDDLASRIGKDVFIDVAGWHLYLRDVKVDGKTTLASALAAKLGSAVADGGFKRAEAEAVLAGLPVRLGGGKAAVPLADAIPAAALGDLWRALEDFERGK